MNINCDHNPRLQNDIVLGSGVRDDGRYDCPRCGKAISSIPTGKKPDNIVLQLLVIDLGESCVVKVEKGENFELMRPVNDGNWHWAISSERSTIVPKSFDEVRKAMEYALDKPVPRIERVVCGPGTVGEGQTIYEIYAPHREVIEPSTYDGLSKLAGKPLPIWTPKSGEWECLIPLQQPEEESGVAKHLRDLVNERIPVEIWRYTLKSE